MLQRLGMTKDPLHATCTDAGRAPQTGPSLTEAFGRCNLRPDEGSMTARSRRCWRRCFGEVGPVAVREDRRVGLEVENC